MHSPAWLFLFSMESKSNQAIREAHKRGCKSTSAGEIIGIRGRILLGKIGTMGYKEFSCRLNGKPVNISYHRFIAYEKYGDVALLKKYEVRHLNGNPLDNSWLNISYGTHSDNMMDVSKEKRLENAIRAASAKRTFSNEQIRAITEDRKNGFTYKQLIAKYNTSKSTLSYFFNKALYVH